MRVKCTKCGYVGEESEFPKGRDMLQQPFIKECPAGCGNRQSPGDASMRMMPGAEHPFVYLRKEPTSNTYLKTIHRATEAS